MYPTQDFFDMPHYYKVLSARKSAGMYMEKASREIQHPLVGKRLKKLSTGEVYTIESAHLHWYMGWYIVFSIERSRSRGIIIWENISSIYEDVPKWCVECHERYSLIGD